MISNTTDAVAVTTVKVSGQPGRYTFSVTLRSDDTGCDAYADWWEVITSTGELRYRRILAHSHVDEQPFTRSGGPVSIDPTEVVIVRGHFAGDQTDRPGYGAIALQGNVNEGFQTVEFAVTLAPEIATLPPLPTSCAF
ncbi:MAG: hypothetical protein AAFY67_23120 [Cyanobacteria bacterium J06642_9]